MDKVRPVFVLGLGRGGTTWLGNVLCRHPQIVGAQHKAHWGIHESKILSHALYWGDLSDDEKFIRFIELYSSGDFFRLVDGDKDYFYAHRPSSFFDFLLTLMDQFAQSRGVVYWTTRLQPTFYHHPKQLTEFISLVEERYGDCKFVGVKRDYVSLLRSYLHVPGSAPQRRLVPFRRQAAIFLETARYVLYYRRIEQIIKAKNGLLLSFSDLEDDLETATQRITNYLGLEHSPEMLKRRYKPNTSFLREEERARAIPKLDLFIGRNLFMPLFSIFPGLAANVIRWRDRMRGNLCPLQWKLLKLQYMRDSFGEELLKAGDVGLYRSLFEESDY